MNIVKLTGIITDIQPSHNTNGVDFEKAYMIVKSQDGYDNVVHLKFKHGSSSLCHNGDTISIVGNLRSFSKKVDGKNKVEIYVFTYFDQQDDNEINDVRITGNICKINSVQHSGEQPIVQFILANNIIKGQSKLNSYIPCVAVLKNEKDLENFNKGSFLNIHGELHSREYKKYLSGDEFEIRVAHELYILDWSVE